MPPQPKNKDSCRVVDCRKKKKKKEAACLPKKSSSVVKPPLLGPRQISIALSYVPNLMRYSTAALIALIYVADFKTVLQYLPFYNGKYVTEDTVKIPKDEVAEIAEVAVEDDAKKAC